MAIDNIFPANSKALLGTRPLFNNNNNNNMNMVDTSSTSGLVGTNNNPTGTGNITNLALTNPNPQELIMVTQGVPSYSGIIQNAGPSGLVGPVVNTGGVKRSHPTRAGKNKNRAPKRITNGIISSTSFSGNNTMINFNNEETIHSGHFMLSQVHDEDTDYEDDVVVKEENDSRAPEGFDFLSATQETSTSYDFGNGCTQFLSIDGSLTKLFECMSLAYSGKIISPKWKPFKGMRLRGKEIVRLNNIIWREWFMQYIQNKKPIVCQFANPLPDDIHKRTEAVVMEGKYWKRRVESVTGEYKSWRKFSKNLIAQARRNSTTSKGSFQNDLYEWSYQGKAGNQEGADIPFSMEDMEFSDTIFSLNQPFPFPNPRELSQTGYAELIQPVLTQLQPNLDDYMDTLEPIQMISDMLSTSRSQGFPSQSSPISASYHSLPDSLFMTMDNDLAPSLQVRMDAASPVISLSNQQLRDKEQTLGILPPSPGVASSTNLHSEVHTVPTSQPDNSGTLSVYPHFALCSPVTSLGDAEVVQRASVPLAAETPIALPQPDTTHLLNKILMEPPSTQTLPQAASHSLNQQTQLVQQPQQQQSALSSRVIAGPPAVAAAAAAAAPASKDDSYSKDIEFMWFKTIYNAYKDPMTPSKQPGQQPMVPSAPLPAPAHTPQPQLSSVHQRDLTPAGGATGNSLPMLAVAQPTRVLHQTGQILTQTSGTNSLVLGATSEGGNNRVITIDRTIDDSPTPDSVGNRSSPTSDLLQVGAVSGRKRHSISKTPSSGRNQGFVIPTTTPMIRSKIRPVTVSPPSIARTEISSSSASSSNTFLAQLLTTGKYHGASTDVKHEPSWKPCIISTVSLATTTTVTSAYPRIQPAQDSTTPTQCTSTNPVTLASSSPNSIPISFTQPSVLGKASSSSSHLSNISTSVLPAVSSPTFSRNQQLQDTSSGFIHGKHANPACSPPDPNSTPNSPTLSLGSPLSSGQEMDTSFPSSQQKGACPKSKQSRGHCREHRRVSHISAEQKRRCNIKSGFDVLHSLIPSLNQTPCGKVSKAAMLQKAAEFCKKMKAERLKMQNESEVLKLEIDSLNSDITYCQSQLPATGAPVTRQRVDQMNNMYTDYVRTRTSENWKFYIFSFIIHPLFKSFNNIVSTASMEEMCRTVMNWFDQYCSLVTLRPMVSNALREVCTSTTILTEPERLPEQAASATGLPRRRHSISGEIDIS